MKKILNILISILPNVVIILSTFFIVLWILNGFNPGMNFLSNKVSNTLLLVLFILSLTNSIITIVIDRKNN